MLTPASIAWLSLGVVALLSGGTLFAAAVLRLPFELPAVPVVLITAGLIVFTGGLRRSREDRAPA